MCYYSSTSLLSGYTKFHYYVYKSLPLEHRLRASKIYSTSSHNFGEFLSCMGFYFRTVLIKMLIPSVFVVLHFVFGLRLHITTSHENILWAVEGRSCDMHAHSFLLHSQEDRGNGRGSFGNGRRSGWFQSGGRPRNTAVIVPTTGFHKRLGTS
jgi:hypothetical protein